MKVFIYLLMFTAIHCPIQSDNLPPVQVGDHVIDPLINKLIKQANLPGVSLAVSKNNQIIFAKAYGYADVERKIEMTTTTTLRTASVAKIITATAIGKLLSEDKLTLDEPISKYVPYIASHFRNLTIRQLAGHTSGVPHRPSNIKLEDKYYNSIKETIDLLKDVALLFEPDEEYSYSTGGYNILSAVIEGASGMTYKEYMRKEIFTPLNMHHTYIENIYKLESHAAALYYIDNDKLKDAGDLVDGSYKVAGAGFRSTPSDLVRMMNAYSNNIISTDVTNLMFTTNYLNNGTDTRVGTSWRLSYDMYGRQVLDHAGSWQGARTVVIYYPVENISVSIMVNASCQLLIEETAQVIAQLFIDNHEESILNNKIECPLKVIFNSTDGSTQNLKGHLSLDRNNHGTLTIDSKKEFLKSIPVFYLGYASSYAAITSYGLLYMDMDVTYNSSISGNIFWYQNRNKGNPTEGMPVISFSSLE